MSGMDYTKKEYAARSIPNRNLSTQQFSPLYHGSPNVIPPGGTIDPGHKAQDWGMTRHGFTYMADSPTRAASWAKGPGYGRKEPGHVYEVEPTGEYGDDPGSSGGFRSRAPLRVKREIPADKVKNMPDPRDLDHGPNYIGKDDQYDADADLFDEKWYGS